MTKKSKEVTDKLVEISNQTKAELYGCNFNNSLNKEEVKEPAPTPKAQGYLYFVNRGKFTIADLEAISQSERTIDIDFNDLANIEPLLSKLNLYYMQGNYGVKYTYESRAQWFAGYICAFSSDDEGNDIRIKLLTNPTVRILVEDKKLLVEIETILDTYYENCLKNK